MTTATVPFMSLTVTARLVRDRCKTYRCDSARQFRAELTSVREAAEAEAALEARARGAALDALRKAVHEELKGLERGVEASLASEHDLWREYEALLPRLERQASRPAPPDMI
eukprot:3763592-Pyramimonas_sp.AAC.1